METRSRASESVVIGPTQQLIDGAWVPAQGGGTVDVECPATRRVIAGVARSGADDVDRAVAAARRAFPAWRDMVPAERGRLMLKIADALDARADDIARLIAHETGNALRTQAKPETAFCINTFRYFGGLCGELKGEMLPLGKSILSYTQREPHGVVAAIIPWNAPAQLASAKLVPALCAGNTIVLKAAEDAPLAVLMIADICNRFLPAGVLNVLVGLGEECGVALVSHPGVDKISFTGSTAVGKSIMRTASDRVLPVSLELGGKSPVIVCEDADADWVAQGIGSAMRFTRQGQSCTAGSRVFVHRAIYDSFLDRVQALMQSYKIGDPLDEATDMGCLVSETQYKRVVGYLEDGLSNHDVQLRVGGLPPKSGPLSEGYFTMPTLFESKSNDWRLAREEIFGPVLVAIPWDDESEVLRMANDSHYGLAAYVFSKNTARAIRLASAIDSGWVQVNQGKGQILGQPYGGFKQSGLGKELALTSMLEGFSRLKTVTVNLEI